MRFDIDIQDELASTAKMNLSLMGWNFDELDFGGHFLHQDMRRRFSQFVSF